MSGSESDQTRNAIKAARKGRWTRARIYAVLGIVGTIAVVSGFAAAQFLAVTAVPERGSAYSGTSTPDPDFPNAPTLTIAQTTTSSCVTNPYSLADTYSGNGFVAISIGVTGSCAQGDAANEWAFTMPASIAADTVTLFFSATYGTGPTTWNYALTVDIPAASNANPSVLAVDVDWGSASFPSGGIASENVVLN